MGTFHIYATGQKPRPQAERAGQITSFETIGRPNSEEALVSLQAHISCANDNKFVGLDSASMRPVG